MHSSHWVLDSKKHLSYRLDCFRYSFNKCIFKVLDIFLFGTTHNKIKGAFLHFKRWNSRRSLAVLSLEVNRITSWIQMLSSLLMQLSLRCPWALLYVFHLFFECYYSCLYVMGQHWRVFPPLPFPTKRPEFLILYKKKMEIIKHLNSQTLFEFCCL